MPPAATPIGITDILSGVLGMFAGQRGLDRFESQLKEHFGVKHCFLVSSGKAALAAILLALKESTPERDEVLIPAFTCFSVPSAIVRAGLQVRLCDLHPDGLDFDFAQLSAVLSAPPTAPASRILAVVPTHLFGVPADVARLRDLLPDRAVTIVEDAAQAMGEEALVGKVGTLGDVSFFSLGRGKPLSVVEGGVILTNRDDLARSLGPIVGRLPRYGLRSLLNLVLKSAALAVLIHPRLFWIPMGMPFLKLGETLFEPDFPMRRMSAFQAGLARGWRQKLHSLRDTRKAHVRRLLAILEAARVRYPRFLNGELLALPRLPLRISDSNRRNAVLRESAERGMGIMPVYPTSIDAIPGLPSAVKDRAFPVAERCARELVTLPTHVYLTERDLSRLGELVARARA